MLQALEELGANVRLLFVPEHGFAATEQAEKPVTAELAGAEDAQARVVSLYGATKEDLIPRPEHLSEIDLLVIDLADVGSRYYTYVWTALLAARAAAHAGVHTLVLDRPNPISGDPTTLEGAPQAEGFLSFVGLEPLPARHAMTLGEILAHFVAQDELPLGPDGALSVIAVQGWERLRTAQAWGRPFVMPSPNMPSWETAMVYPGACLLEGTNLSEGRGTTAPFQLVGAPFLRSGDLARRLEETGVPGAWVRPVSFRPTFEKHAGQLCHGVMIHITNAHLFRPLATYLSLITIARGLTGDAFSFRNSPYEFETDRPAFDLLTGSDRARQAILEGATPEDVVRLVAPVDSSWREVVAMAEARLVRCSA